MQIKRQPQKEPITCDHIHLGLTFLSLYSANLCLLSEVTLVHIIIQLFLFT